MAKGCVVCDKEAVSKCGGCGKVLYCGEQHKKDNFNEHKGECRPYRIEKNEKYGRYLVTNRGVKQGELLLRERPLVVGPRVDSLPACLECLSLLGMPLKRCLTCHVVPLCTRCTHNSNECSFYAGLSQHHKDLYIRSSNQYVLPLRILLHLKSEKEKYKEILELESHQEMRRGSNVWYSHEKNVVELLQTCGAISNSEQDSELVQRICGVLDVNSFEVRGAAGLAGAGMRLRGVYPQAALMAHDCITNVHLSVDDNFVMTIRASVDIPEGHPIVYNYTDPLKMTSERQRHLQEGKYFMCTCRRCADPTELGTYLGAVRCPRCKKGYILSSVTQDWLCEACGHRYSPGVIETTCSLARDRMEALDRTDPRQLEEMLLSLGNSLAPTHSIMVDVKQSIVAAYREMEPTRQSLLRKVELCRELLPILQVIEPGISRLRGITLYELHIGLVSLAQERGAGEEAGPWLREAEEVLKEAVGLLLYEPTESPEGELARQAMAELRTLKQMIAKHEAKEKKNKKAKNKK